MALLNPYINFGGNAKEALEFYQSVFGGEVNSSTFGEFGMPGVDADEQDKIMHGQLTTERDMTLMVSDSPRSMGELKGGNNITISLSGDDDAELRGYWDKLVDGGSVGVPLEAAPWGDAFGQLTDKFGIAWLVNIVGAGSGEGSGGAGEFTEGSPAE